MSTIISHFITCKFINLKQFHNILQTPQRDAPHNKIPAVDEQAQKHNARHLFVSFANDFNRLDSQHPTVNQIFKMYSGKILLGAAGFASLAQALVSLTNSDYSGITAGVPFEITWAGQSEGSTVALLLKNGDASNQMLFRTIGSKYFRNVHFISPANTFTEELAGTNYVWTPETDIPEGTYNLEIDDSNGDVNYSPQFEILNGVELPITSTPMPAPTATEIEVPPTYVAPTYVAPTYIAPTEVSTEIPAYEAGVTATSVVGAANSTAVFVPETTIVPVMSTGGPTYGNMTSSSGIYANTTMTSVSYVVPSTTASKYFPVQDIFSVFSFFSTHANTYIRWHPATSDFHRCHCWRHPSGHPATCWHACCRRGDCLPLLNTHLGYISLGVLVD